MNLFRSKNRFIYYIIPTVILIVAVIYLKENLPRFREIRVTSKWALGGLILCSLLESIPGGGLFKKLLNLFKVRLNLMEAVGLVYITAMGNYIIPYLGGMGLRATYLKRRYNFPLSYFASTVAGTALLSFLINAFLGLVVMIYLSLWEGLQSGPLTFLFLVFFISSFLLIIVPFKGVKSKRWFFQKLNQVLEGWKIISKDKKELVGLSSIIFLSAVLRLFSVYFAFRILTENITFLNSAVISSMSSMSGLISFTPAGLGINELVIVFTSRTLGYLVVLSVSVVLIQRVVTTVIVFIGGTISSYALSKAAISSDDGNQKTQSPD